MIVNVRTEQWSTRNGRVAKAVVRRLDGTFIGATNETGTVKARTPRPRVTIKGKR